MGSLVPGATQLRRWLKASGRGAQGQLAERLGVESQTIWTWAKGTRIPAAVHRAALESVTLIPADAWMTVRERQMLRRLSTRDGKAA